MAKAGRHVEDTLFGLTGFVSGAIIASTLTGVPAERLPEPQKIEWLQEQAPPAEHLVSGHPDAPKIQELLQ